MTVSERVTIPIQINGKLGAKVEVALVSRAKKVERLARCGSSGMAQGNAPKKVIYVDRSCSTLLCEGMRGSIAQYSVCVHITALIAVMALVASCGYQFRVDGAGVQPLEVLIHLRRRLPDL